MKEWKEYLFKVNGFEMTAIYNEDTIQKVFLPLLKQLQQLQKEKKERIIVFMAAPPAVGKTTLCEFLEYLSKQDQEFTDIQALGLDGFHYHSDYINSHDAIVLGEKVPMKQVKERLISRKEKGGLTREEAVAWYQNSDSKNVTRVLKNSCRKHLNLLLQVEQDNDYLQVK